MIALTSKPILIAGALLAAGGIYYGFTRYHQRIGADRVTSKQTTAVVKRQAEVITINQSKDDKAAKVDHHVQDQFQDIRRDVDRADAELGRLRDALAAARASAMSEATTRASLAATLTAATDSLGECSREYQAVADERDRLAVQVGGLLKLKE